MERLWINWSLLTTMDVYPNSKPMFNAEHTYIVNKIQRGKFSRCVVRVDQITAPDQYVLPIIIGPLSASRFVRKRFYVAGQRIKKCSTVHTALHLVLDQSELLWSFVDWSCKTKNIDTNQMMYQSSVLLYENIYGMPFLCCRIMEHPFWWATGEKRPLFYRIVAELR